jgi:tRNA pseudouridine55 synthase
MRKRDGKRDGTGTGMSRSMDGILIVDKPEGFTSLDVAREMKRRFGVRKAGHIGTLDPFATGVLPIVINEGTKLVPFLEEGPKEYEVTLRLGDETTTDDWTGQVVMSRPWGGVRAENVKEVVGTFLGKIRQTPPMFSAIKMNGRRLYRLARKGIEVERKQREVEIYEIRVEGIDLPFVRLRVSCSKGTYIRALGRDIGNKIGCGAHLFRLRRTRSGPFTLDEAISWERIKECTHASRLFPWLISLKAALPALPEVVGDEELVRKVRLGRKMVVQDVSLRNLPAFEKGECLKICSLEEELVAVLRCEMGGADIRGASPEAVAFRSLRIFQPGRG